MLIGVALHIVISLLCALAPGIGTLIALRVAQGFFNAAATVVAIAVIRDASPARMRRGCCPG